MDMHYTPGEFVEVQTALIENHKSISSYIGLIRSVAVEEVLAVHVLWSVGFNIFIHRT
jgi:hypothetical protein